MYVTSFTTNDFDNNTDIIFSNNYTDNEINIFIIMPTLLLTSLYGLCFSCLLSLMVYT